MKCPYLCRIPFSFIMKILGAIFCFAFIFCLEADTSSAQKKDSVMLKLHLKKGDKYTLTSKSITNSTLDSKGKSFSIDQDMNSEFLVSVNDIKDNGMTVVSYTLEYVTLNMQVNSENGITKIGFDSRDPSKSVRDEGKDMFEKAHKLIGMTFWAELNDQAEVIRTNIDTIKALYQTEKEDGAYEIIFGNAMQISAATPSYAGYPVKIGETWKGIVYQNTEGKTVSGKSDFKLNSVHGHLAKISSMSKGWGDVSDGSLNGTSNNTYTIDIPSGWPTESSHKQQYNIKTQIEGKEVPIKGTIDLTIKITKKK